MSVNLITMLTYNDETVKNACEIFNQCADIPANFWGFKDVGLSIDQMKQLVNTLNEKGKTTFLEVVSLSEDECLRGAQLALDCNFDYLMGTVFYQSVFELLKNTRIKFFPFCGEVTGHPSILEGSMQSIVHDAEKMVEIGVKGFDLLAYRFTGNPVELTKEFLSAINKPVVVAGSINSFARLDTIKKLNPWAFTIGSAFFDKLFVKGGTFRDQIERVLDYLEE